MLLDPNDILYDICMDDEEDEYNPIPIETYSTCRNHLPGEYAKLFDECLKESVQTMKQDQ